MKTLASTGRPRTVAEWLEQPEEARLELIDGDFVEKASPTFEHGVAQSQTAAAIAMASARMKGNG